MTSTQVRIDVPSLYGTTLQSYAEPTVRYSHAPPQFAVVFVVKNASSAQVRYSSVLGASFIYGTVAPDVRPVTRREDHVLRRAALRGARVIHRGILAAK